MADWSGRFWAKVDRGAGCWEWLASKDNRGYGQFARETSGRPLKAHRVSWELANGPVPTGMVVCHRCDNPGCVNPAHLFIGTQGDNLRDMWSKGRGFSGPRVTHCRQGHEYTPATTRILPSGYRTCRICRTENSRRSRLKDPKKHREHARRYRERQRAALAVVLTLTEVE